MHAYTCIYIFYLLKSESIILERRLSVLKDRLTVQNSANSTEFRTECGSATELSLLTYGIRLKVRSGTVRKIFALQYGPALWDTEKHRSV